MQSESRAGQLIAQLCEEEHFPTPELVDLDEANKGLAYDVIRGVERAFKKHDLNNKLYQYKREVAVSLGLIVDTLDDGDIPLGTFFNSTKSMLNDAGRPFRLT